MLGGDLLVAPIFNAQGIASYYLPEGKWTNILTETVSCGGRWMKESYDFMTLPLMARPGSVIPIGAVCKRPDYDYLSDVALHIYQMEDGDERTVRIPDLQGNTAAVFRIECRERRIYIQTDSDQAYRVAIHRDGQLREKKGLLGDVIVE